MVGRVLLFFFVNRHNNGIVVMPHGIVSGGLGTGSIIFGTSLFASDGDSNKHWNYVLLLAMATPILILNYIFSSDAGSETVA